MSGSQKVLRFFGILDIVMSIVASAALITGVVPGGIGSYIVNILLAVLGGVLFLVASCDASRYFGAWLIALIQLIMNAAVAGLLVFGIIGGVAVLENMGMVIIALAVNIFVFTAADNLRKQAKKGKTRRSPMAY